MVYCCSHMKKKTCGGDRAKVSNVLCGKKVCWFCMLILLVGVLHNGNRFFFPCVCRQQSEEGRPTSDPPSK